MSNKIILVTGGAGYIGSHVCKALSQHGFTPITYDSLSSGNKNAVQWGPFEQGDIRDRGRLRDILRKYNPAAIMHFAALIQVGESVIDPAIYYHNNVYGSLCLLEEARAQNIKHMIFSSTAAVYGIPEISPVPENATQAPINPYGQTKLMMERMIHDYAAAYDMKYAILRYFNAAGADPDSETGSAYKTDSHIIPLLMRVASGLLPEIKLFGEDYDTPDGTAIRDYIHVTDLAKAHVLSLNHILSGGDNITINIGTNHGYSVLEVIEAAKRITKKDIPVVKSPRRAGDPAILVADAMQAQNVIQWQPALSSLDSIVQTAWNWRQKQNKAMGK